MRFFGSEDQQAMARRAALLWGLVKDDPRFAWYGRNVALADYHADGPDVFEALVRLQGATPAYRVRREREAEVSAEIEARGLRTDNLSFSLSADDSSVARAREFLADHRLPGDLTLTQLGPDSPDADLDAFAEIALMGGVLPPPDGVLRGEVVRGVALLAREAATGRPVGSAASFENFHPDGPMAGFCFWGMLATHPERRGEKIALVLGAEAMVRMHRLTGIGRFSTGIREGNTASETLCAKFGVGRSDFVIVSGLDPGAFSGDRITK